MFPGTLHGKLGYEYDFPWSVENGHTWAKDARLTDTLTCNPQHPGQTRLQLNGLMNMGFTCRITIVICIHLIINMIPDMFYMMGDNVGGHRCFSLYIILVNNVHYVIGSNKQFEISYCKIGVLWPWMIMNWKSADTELVRRYSF